MNISILAVGTELLMGKTVNTNATYLSKAINNLGHNVLYHLTVGDNPVRLKDTLNYLLSVSDMVITTGGLGPTQDDLTKETIASTMNVELLKDELAYKQLIERFKLFNVKMTDNNVKQVDLPTGCIPLYNEKGTAPGFILEKDDKVVAALPGPPREMKHMFELSLSPYLTEKTDCKIVSEYIHLFGIGESSAETLIEDLVSKQTNPSIAIYASIGEVSIRVTAKADTEKQGLNLIKPTVKALSERLKNYIIGYGNTSLISETINQISTQNLSLSLAESCTGGMIASEFISHSGASSYFDQGFVTYSNKAKHDLLKVSDEILETYGAVSPETCEAMVKGLYGLSKSDICLSVTGIAGPSGGTSDKPVGLVYIGLKFKDQIEIKKYNFTGDRHVVRRKSLLNAFNMILKNIHL